LDIKFARKPEHSIKNWNNSVSKRLSQLDLGLETIGYAQTWRSMANQSLRPWHLILATGTCGRA
jgi:hypothetical protein